VALATAAPGTVLIAVRLWTAAAGVAASAFRMLGPYVHPAAITLAVLAVVLVALAVPAWRGNPFAVAAGTALLVVVALVSAQLVVADRSAYLLLGVALLGAAPGAFLVSGPAFFNTARTRR
jgi:hypothetical protein